MKTLSLLVVTLALIVARTALAQSVVGEIKQLDAAMSSFTITGAKGDFRQFRTKLTTEILINGKPVAFKDLSLGIQALVTPGEAGYAARIVSPPPGLQAKAASGQSAVKVSANALKANPVIVGSVTAGQKVTITPKKIWWSGGGSKKGQFCDWRGYDPEHAKGIPWMALVAAVGANEFWAKDNTLSFTVPANGNLVLYASDDKAGNEGEGNVVVTIAPK